MGESITNPISSGGLSGSAGASGSFTPDNNGSQTHWFGFTNSNSGNNNVLRWLQDANGGTVTIASLDNSVRAANQNQWYVWQGSSYQLNAGIQLGPYWNENDHIYSNFSPQTVTVNNGTTRLNTNVDPASHYGVNSVFDIRDEMIKTGNGILSLEINKLKITTVTANANSGTLQLANSGTAVLQQGTLTSTTANLNGGDGSTGSAGNNYQTAYSSFRFNSESNNNIWSIVTLNEKGFNSTGIMNVSGNATLNRTTLIDSARGQLNVTGMVNVGNDNGQSVLNVRNEGTLIANDSFIAASNTNSNVYFNIDGVSKIITRRNTSLATAAGSSVNGRITSASTWTNTGNFVVAQNVTANLTVTDINSQLISNGGDIIVADNAGSVGTLHVDQSGTVSTNSDIYVGKNGSSIPNNGANGTLTADNGAKVTAGGHINVAQGTNSTGILFSGNGAAVTAGTYIEVAMASNSGGTITADGGGTDTTITATDGHFTLGGSGHGTMNIAGKGKISIKDAGNSTFNAGNAYFGNEKFGYGKGTVTNEDSLFEVDHHLIVGNDGTGLLYVNDKGKVTVGGQHIIANQGNSFGRDTVNGYGTTLDVTGDLIVGNQGQADGYYNYIDVGFEGGYKKDPTSKGTPSGTSWYGSDNLNLSPTNSNWNTVKDNSPGLAIVAGGVTNVAGNVFAGQNRDGYAYILVDNIDKGQVQWFVGHFFW
jgi:T5SS/PEP-CTERM-associated repeat protein